MSRTMILVALAAGLMLTAWLAAGCGSDGGQERVALESVIPSSGPHGTEVVLHGSGFMTAGNDVGFTHPDIEFQGKHTAYLNNLSSADGSTLRFSLPEILGACATSQLGPDEGCPDIGLSLPEGDSEVFVVNDNGSSNSLTFFVIVEP